MVEFLKDFFDIESILILKDSIAALGQSLIRLFGNTFSWLGNDTLIALGIGITIAIILRICGR